MRGIIIAAGRGVRMRPLTEDQPKCLLPIAGRTLLDWTIDGLRGAGCDEVVVVTGHAADAIDRDDIVKVRNTDYVNNNILHSLMYARDYLDQDCVVSYSDIWVEPPIFRAVAGGQGDIRIAADIDWTPYYEQRTRHPIEEAENAFIAPDTNRVLKIGKHLIPDQAGDLICAEFLGLWAMSAAGARRFRDAFESVDRDTDPLAPFQAAKEWRKAYVTDMVQRMVDDGVDVDSVTVERGWAELDTQQDYDRLMDVAERQRLSVLANWKAKAGAN
jgi:choline kinase